MWIHPARRVASGAVGREAALVQLWPSRLRMASPKILRAEFPVHRKRTL